MPVTGDFEQGLHRVVFDPPARRVGLRLVSISDIMREHFRDAWLSWPALVLQTSTVEGHAAVDWKQLIATANLSQAGVCRSRLVWWM